MAKDIPKPPIPVVAGMAMLAAWLLALLLIPGAWRETLRQRAFDLVLAADRWLNPAAEAPVGAPVVVIDIDRRSIEALGPWPWPRETMARLAQAVAEGRPAVVAVDILFAEADARSPAALARRLGALSGRADLLALADDLPDGDRLFARALEGSPAVLGFVLDPDRTESVPAAPVVTRGALPFRELWHAAGAVGPTPTLASVADGLGALSLPGDADGVIRRVPLFVGAAGGLLPGLALEAVRLRSGASAYLIQAEAQRLRAGDRETPLPQDGLLRLVPVPAEHWTARTVSAVDIVEGRAETGRLNGAVALVGGSAPELGGLRPTPSDPLTPSVQIQADAVAQILAGRVPRLVDETGLLEPLVMVGIGVVAIAAGAALPPLAGVVVTLTAVGLVWASALSLAVLADRLLDPVTPSAAAAFAFVAASVSSYAVTRRREALVRRRFEQHLAPAVVRQIVERPDLMKLGGERREVTALFTDVEGFTAMTHRADPEQLVAVLDDYFEEAAAIVIEHGGMVDKIVGDALHALFNAPLDLDDHPRHAVDCAAALREWSHRYSSRPGPSAIGFGRTRIGVETGPAVVGDIGIRTKLDYTAHGDAINAAARLEAANKEFGSTICVGPTAAARCDPALFRPLGTIVVRGRDDPMAVFEPWPADASPAWRDRYRAAFGLIEEDAPRAAALFDQLAAERPDDPVPQLMAGRLRSVMACSEAERGAAPATRA